jgi:hypothetical protein
MTVATRSLSKNEQGVLAAAILAALLSLMPAFIQVTFDGQGYDMSTSAWTSYATIGMVLLLGAATLVVTAALSDDTLPASVPWHLVAVIAAGLGTLLIVLRVFTMGSSTPGVTVGPGWSGWLLIVVAGALTFFAVRTFQESEDELDFSDPEE